MSQLLKQTLSREGKERKKHRRFFFSRLQDGNAELLFLPRNGIGKASRFRSPGIVSSLPQPVLAQLHLEPTRVPLIYPLFLFMPRFFLPPSNSVTRRKEQCLIYQRGRTRPIEVDAIEASWETPIQGIADRLRR